MEPVAEGPYSITPVCKNNTHAPKLIKGRFQLFLYYLLHGGFYI
jgi:hypothetical protein